MQLMDVKAFLDHLPATPHSRSVLDIVSRHPVHPSFGALPGFRFSHEGARFVIFCLKGETEMEVTVVKDGDARNRGVVFSAAGGFCPKWRGRFVLFAETFRDSALRVRGGDVYYENLCGRKKLGAPAVGAIPETSKAALARGEEVPVRASTWARMKLRHELAKMGKRGGAA